MCNVCMILLVQRILSSTIQVGTGVVLRWTRDAFAGRMDKRRVRSRTEGRGWVVHVAPKGFFHGFSVLLLALAEAWIPVCGVCGGCGGCIRRRPQ
jgi:hypothetical protein